DGRVRRARHLLARPFCILGTPGRGRGYGSKYTVPTINLARYEELVPKDGVYITWTRVGTERFDSVTNVGNRPTFGDELFAIETHLLNFHPIELRPETEVEISFLDRLRDEIKFPSVDALREQIARDVKRPRRYYHLLGQTTLSPEARAEALLTWRLSAAIPRYFWQALQSKQAACYGRRWYLVSTRTPNHSSPAVRARPAVTVRAVSHPMCAASHGVRTGEIAPPM